MLMSLRSMSSADVVPGGSLSTGVARTLLTEAGPRKLQPGVSRNAFSDVVAVGLTAAGTGQSFARATNFALHSGSKYPVKGATVARTPGLTLSSLLRRYAVPRI